MMRRLRFLCFFFFAAMHVPPCSIPSMHRGSALFWGMRILLGGKYFLKSCDFFCTKEGVKAVFCAFSTDKVNIWGPKTNVYTFPN
jgi:hypothetical protein